MDYNSPEELATIVQQMELNDPSVDGIQVIGYMKKNRILDPYEAHAKMMGLKTPQPEDNEPVTDRNLNQKLNNFYDATESERFPSPPPQESTEPVTSNNLNARLAAAIAESMESHG